MMQFYFMIRSFGNGGATTSSGVTRAILTAGSGRRICRRSLLGAGGHRFGLLIGIMAGVNDGDFRER